MENISWNTEILREVEVLAKRLPSPRAWVLEADHSLKTIIRFMALLKSGHTVFMLPPWAFQDLSYRKNLNEEACTDFIPWALAAEEIPGDSPGKLHSEIASAIEEKMARFIVRTSGSSGTPKLILHDPERFRKKYQMSGKHFERTFWFSPADSIAGIETILEASFYGADVVIHPDKLTPTSVIEAIEKFSVDYFQTTPSFLNLMMVAGKFRNAPPASLKKMAYGSEPAQEKVLEIIRENWPSVKLIQTYGMSEIGILRTLETPNGYWFSLDETINPKRIVNGRLEVHSVSALLTYLNSPSQFTSDGWFQTHDEVVAEDGLFRVTGRAGDMINVGGRKFFPAELEAYFLRHEKILDATVRRVTDERMGMAIIAEIFIPLETDEREFRKELNAFIGSVIPSHMRPHKIELVKNPQETPRFKKMRN